MSAECDKYLGNCDNASSLGWHKEKGVVISRDIPNLVVIVQHDKLSIMPSKEVSAIIASKNKDLGRLT